MVNKHGQQSGSASEDTQVQSSRQTELSASTWRHGHHVIVLGDYKPLAKDFTPSVRTSAEGPAKS